MGIEEFVLDRAEKKEMAKGLAKGEARAEAKIIKAVKNLITKMGSTDARISEMLEVPSAFVEKIRQELNK